MSTVQWYEDEISSIRNSLEFLVTRSACERELDYCSTLMGEIVREEGIRDEMARLIAKIDELCVQIREVHESILTVIDVLLSTDDLNVVVFYEGGNTIAFRRGLRLSRDFYNYLTRAVLPLGDRCYEILDEE